MRTPFPALLLSRQRAKESGAASPAESPGVLLLRQIVVVVVLHTHTHIYIYIYIYICKEIRERDKMGREMRVKL